MGFGAGAFAASAAAITALYLTFLGAALVALVVSTVYFYLSRRAVAWTPLILAPLLLLWPGSLLLNQSWRVFLAVSIGVLVIWLPLVWPRQGASAATRTDKKRWHPAVALTRSVGTFLGVCSLSLVILAATYGQWDKATSIKPLPPPPATKKTVSPLPVPPPPSTKTVRRARAHFGVVGPYHGLTWTTLDAVENDGTRYVLVGVDEVSNAYYGDTPPSAHLPILAIRPSDVAAPPHVGANLWSKGEVTLTDRIQGHQLTSLNLANELIQHQQGREWRMASFHDAAGWKFWAKGDLEVGINQRFWVYISDQPANPWNE